jgi:hypothetical protein
VRSGSLSVMWSVDSEADGLDDWSGVWNTILNMT